MCELCEVVMCVSCVRLVMRGKRVDSRDLSLTFHYISGVCIATTCCKLCGLFQTLSAVFLHPIATHWERVVVGRRIA